MRGRSYQQTDWTLTSLNAGVLDWRSVPTYLTLCLFVFISALLSAVGIVDVLTMLCAQYKKKLIAEDAETVKLM